VSSQAGADRQSERIAVITGGAAGLGQAYALRLAADGIRIVVADVADARETQSLIAARGGDCSFISCDVSRPEDVTALATFAAGEGGADILVHNAGIYPLQSLDDITFEDWRRVMSVNVDSLFLLTQAFLPYMREQRWGRIVGVATNMFHLGLPGAPHYVASKGAVIGFVRSVAAEVGEDGVTVNAIAPGLIRTPGTSTGVHDERGVFDVVLSMQAIKHMGMADDVSGTMSFLVSDAAAFVTGQTIVVDGGMAYA
jgi:3-oxoacyl-[acyl-carrier protein] reductase